jgi:hypothetical protein
VVAPPLPDFEAVPPTGDVRADLAAIREAQAKQAGAATFARAVGGAMGALAITMAGFALDLASQAAVDHSRVDRLEAQERANGDRLERMLEAQTRTIAQLEQLQTTVADLRHDVRELRGAERRNEDDGGRR